MRRCLLVFSLLLAVCALTGCDKPAPPAPQWHWQMLTVWPPQSAELAAAEHLAQQVASMSNGRLQISVSPAATQAAAGQVLSALSNGTVQLAYGTAAAWQAQGASAALANALPFDLSPLQLNSWLSQGGGQALWAEAYQELGIKPLAAGSSALPMGGWSNVEITQLADLIGLKIAGTGTSAALWRRLGANSSSLNDEQLVEALRNGTLHASAGKGPVLDQSLGLGQGAAYYYLDWPTPPTLLELLVNQSALASLPADLQAILEQASHTANQESLDRATYSNAIALDQLHQTGSQIKRLPAEVRAALQQQSILLLGEQAAQSELNGRIWASLQAFQALSSTVQEQ